MQLSQRTQSWARSASIALVLATLVVVPLLTPPSPEEWIGKKQILFHVLTLALIGLALCQADPSAGAGRWRRLISGPNLPAVLLVVLGAISFATSDAKSLSSPEFLRLTCGVGLYFVIAAFFRGRDRLQLVVDALIGVVILTAILGFVNYRAMEGQGLTASFGNRQLFAGFLVLVAPLVLCLAFTEMTPGRRLATQIAAVLVCASLLLAQTRSAWIGALVGLAIVAAIMWREGQAEGRRGRLRQGAFLIPLLLIVGATGLFLSMSRTAPQISDRVASLSAVDEDNSWKGRQIQWQGTLKMIAERPLLGWGIGTYPIVQSRFVSASMPAELIKYRGASLLEMAHNEYLQLTAEMGLLGLLAYLGVLGGFFFTTGRALKSVRTGLPRVVLIGAMAGVAGQAVDAISNPAWRFADVSLFFWAMMGLGVAAATKRASQTATATAAKPVAARPTWSAARLGWQGAVGLLVGVMMHQAVAQSGGTSPTYPVLQARSAFVRPQIGLTYPGQTIQYKLLVRLSNGEFLTLTGPQSGLSWTVLDSKTGGPSPHATEVTPGSGIFRSSTASAAVGKTVFIRGFFTFTSPNGPPGRTTTVAAVGRLKIAVPFGVSRVGSTASTRPR